MLFSLDTVRADRVAGTGASTATPHLRAIADEGVVFRRFYAASNYTIPSHMTMFTGLDPVEHGVTRDDARLAPGVPTLAGTLAAAGYRTQAFHEGVYVSERFGFDRGFEEYRGVPLVDVVRRQLPGILAWMRAHAGEPYFLFLHTYAAHYPYGGFYRYRSEHPERGLPSDAELAELRRRYPFDDAGRGAATRELPPQDRLRCTLINQLMPAQRARLGCGADVLPAAFQESPHFAADLAAIVSSYERRIQLVDRALGAIRQLLVALDQWDDTLLVVTSDHGEAFFEHGLYQHAYVPFDEVLRVPLVISYPHLLRESDGRVVTGIAWHADLLPTILGFAGAAPPEPLRGRDLRPVLLGREALPEDRAVFPAVLRPAYQDQQPARRVAVRGWLKYIEGHEAFGDPDGFLFDLGADPAEQRNLRARRVDAFEGLARQASDYARGLSPRPPVSQTTGRPLVPDPGAPPVPLADEEARRLRALGYADLPATAESAEE